jgi:hypothetical protein
MTLINSITNNRIAFAALLIFLIFLILLCTDVIRKEISGTIVGITSAIIIYNLYRKLQSPNLQNSDRSNEINQYMQEYSSNERDDSRVYDQGDIQQANSEKRNNAAFQNRSWAPFNAQRKEKAMDDKKTAVEQLENLEGKLAELERNLLNGENMAPSPLQAHFKTDMSGFNIEKAIKNVKGDIEYKKRKIKDLDNVINTKYTGV